MVTKDELTSMSYSICLNYIIENIVFIALNHKKLEEDKAYEYCKSIFIKMELDSKQYEYCIKGLSYELEL